MPETAPKPRRTRRRILWTALLLFVAFIAWQAYDILTGKPDPKIDYATPFYELCASAQPEGENAWPDFVEVLRRAETAKTLLEQDPAAKQTFTDGSTSLGGFHDLLYMPLDSPKVQKHIEALDELHANGTFGLSARMAAAPRCVEPRIEPTPFHEAYSRARMALSSPFRQFAKTQTARMRLAAHDQDWNEYCSALDESLVAIRFMKFRASLIDHVVATACLSLVLGELQTTLVENQLTAQTAGALLRIIDQRAPLPSAAHTLAGEHLLELDQLQHQYTASGRVPVSSFGQFTASAGIPGLIPATPKTIKMRIADVAATIIPGHGKAQQLHAEYVDEIARLVQSRELRDTEAPTSVWSRSMPLHQVVISSSTMSTEALAFGWRREAHDIAATRILIAIELYRVAHGREPASLEDLVPEVLPELPLDPLNGRTWGYCRRSPDSHGTTYLLWSFGLDGEDNGGSEGASPPWSRHAPGTDIWINKPRYIPEGLMR